VIARLRPYAFLLLVPAVPWLQSRIDASPLFSTQREMMYLWSGERLRRYIPGFEDVLADVYWLRTVQYFGSHRLFVGDGRFDLLRPLIEITTTLDPRLEMAYRYGAIFLSEPKPAGAGDPDGGIAILEKGIRNLPQSWTVRQDLGFCLYFFKHDLQRASDVLIEASALPGAPPWLRPLAGTFLAKGGDRQKSRAIWTALYQQGEGIMKSNALWHLQHLDALDERDRLNSLVKRFQETTGRLPASFQELRAAGLLRQIPADPSGQPYVYDPTTGAVSIFKDSKFSRPE
jgi:hypothetical protein